MPFVTFAERHGMEKGLKQGREEGRRQGLLEGLRLALKLKFGEAGTALMPELERQEKLATIEAVYNAVESATSVEDLRQLLPAAGSGHGNAAPTA
jgi:hypothetical protein